MEISSASRRRKVNPKTQNAVNVAMDAVRILVERGEHYDHDGIIEKNAHAYIMKMLFPSGPEPGIAGVVRYKQISHIVDKLCRYRLNVKEDNLLDIANYSFLLAAFDREQETAT